jgi:hypothetical protein
MPYIKFPNRELRDNIYDAVNNARTDTGDFYLPKSADTKVLITNVSTYSDDYISFDRDNVRDFGQFGEFMQMFKGK